MSKLPNHMVPRNNSSGEKYRERQLMIQLPRQDLSISYCKHLRTAVERRIYDEFVNSRNEVALDIGFVSAQLTAPTVSKIQNYYYCITKNITVIIENLKIRISGMSQMQRNDGQEHYGRYVSQIRRRRRMASSLFCL